MKCDDGAKRYRLKRGMKCDDGAKRYRLERGMKCDDSYAFSGQYYGGKKFAAYRCDNEIVQA